MARKAAGLSRDKKLENLIKNHSMIFMGMFEEAFLEIAETMTEAMAAGTTAIAEAFGGSKKPGAGTPKLKDALALQVRMRIGDVFSGIREEMESQWPKNSSVFKQYVSSPAFD